MYSTYLHWDADNSTCQAKYMYRSRLQLKRLDGQQYVQTINHSNDLLITSGKKFHFILYYNF